MGKMISFTSDRFHPTAGELDDAHEDYINPGVFAKELSAFLVDRLESKGIKIADNFAEDWGRMVEISHDKGFRLAVCCANQEDDAHLVYFSPRRPFVRKWFKKIPVQDELDKLFDAVHGILRSAEGISDLTVEDAV